MSEINTTRQSDAAYDQLKSDIVLGKLAPGTEHTEIGLAKTYGMGRAAIRVALTRLGEIQLIEAVPRRGFLITPISASSIRDLFETRLIIEPAAARLATGRVDIRALKNIDKPIPEKALPQERLNFLAANHAFHMTIADATGNRRLAHIMAGLLDEMCRLINVGLFGSADSASQDSDGKRIQQAQHANLIIAFEKGDADAVEQISRAHIESSYSMARERIFDRSLNIAL